MTVLAPHFFLNSGNSPYLISFVVIQLSIGLAVVCVPYLRWKRPDLARPIRVSLIFPIIYIIATLFIVTVPCIASPLETGVLFL